MLVGRALDGIALYYRYLAGQAMKDPKQSGPKPARVLGSAHVFRNDWPDEEDPGAT